MTGNQKIQGRFSGVGFPLHSPIIVRRLMIAQRNSMGGTAWAPLVAKVRKFIDG